MPAIMPAILPRPAPTRTASRNPHMTVLFMSDQTRVPDWRGALLGGRASGLILRDYDAPDRAAMAHEMRAFCRRHGLSFAVAGDARLAQACGARFHCPSYLLGLPAQRLGRARADDSAAVHHARDMLVARRAGFQNILIAPAFATRSHPGASGLGVLRMQQLARQARALGLRPLALGGMDAAHWQRLTGTGPSLFAGYAAIDAFATARG